MSKNKYGRANDDYNKQSFSDSDEVDEDILKKMSELGKRMKIMNFYFYCRKGVI